MSVSKNLVEELKVKLKGKFDEIKIVYHIIKSLKKEDLMLFTLITALC